MLTLLRVSVTYTCHIEPLTRSVDTTDTNARQKKICWNVFNKLCEHLLCNFIEQYKLKDIVSLSHWVFAWSEYKVFFFSTMKYRSH